MSDANKANFVATSNYDASADDAASTATMPTTGASKGLVLGDLAGLDYDDKTEYAHKRRYINPFWGESNAVFLCPQERRRSRNVFHKGQAAGV